MLIFQWIDENRISSIKCGNLPRRIGWTLLSPAKESPPSETRKSKTGSNNPDGHAPALVCEGVACEGVGPTCEACEGVVRV